MFQQTLTVKGSGRLVPGIALLLAVAALACAGAGSKQHSAVTPVPRSDTWWTQRHEAVKERIKQGRIDLVFIGDSITHSWEESPTRAWENHGAEIWEKYYAPRHAVNLGFSGDRTQHVLWRLEHGEIDGLSPKLVVLMVGSNNSNYEYNTSEEIADGIIAIVDRLHTKLPQAKVLVLGIFPRAEKPCPQREKNEKANALVRDFIAAEAAKGKTYLHYLDLGPKFLAPDGTLSSEIMPDFLHPNAKGYEIWAKTMEPLIVELMGEKR